MKKYKLLILLFILIGFVLELKTSYVQSFIFNRKASKAEYVISNGKNSTIIYPKTGPFNIRAGYTSFDSIINNLGKNGWMIEKQANWNNGLRDIVLGNYSLPHKEKDVIGLSIFDKDNNVFYRFNKPQNTYKTFEEIPKLLIDTLLFVENGELLDGYKNKNPVIEWDRLFSNVGLLLLNKIGFNTKANGASTLATQIEKFKHSPNGKTEIGGKKSIKEKYRQIVSASMKAYKNSRNTKQYRKDIVVEFVNSVPLGAISNYGEVFGFGDAMYMWYGIDFNTLNKSLLNYDPKIFKYVLSLILAERRPNYYLNKNAAALEALCATYLNLLYKNGIISHYLYINSLKTGVIFNKHGIKTEKSKKGDLNIRNSLFTMLRNNNLYDMNNMDIETKTVIDRSVQNKINLALANIDLSDLKGRRLLATHNDLNDLNIGFTLFKSNGNVNDLIIQTDNENKEFNINDGMKLELGSTAKLRTLVTYLETIAEIYSNIKNRHSNDNLSKWVLKQVNTKPELTIGELLELAMNKKYSGSPSESFYTGGGMHTFSNFEGKYNGIITVRQAFYMSVNLVFIRIMKDIVDYTIQTKVIPDGLTDDLKKKYVDRFIIFEGNVYLDKFYNKYNGLDKNKAFELMIDNVPKIPFRLATAYRTVYPKNSIEDFTKFINSKVKYNKSMYDLYNKYEYGKYNWQDLGYITRLHPLELWLVAYMQDNILTRELRKKAIPIINESYNWILKPNKERARKRGISQLLEIDAFHHIHKKWRNVGYSFPKLVPSYATAIGSSGDKPISLARLVGIIINNGNMCKERKFEYIHFGKNTPYESLLKFNGGCKNVIDQRVADVVKNAMLGVVNNGTARKIKSAYKEFSVGGKTGTGDNKYKIYNKKWKLKGKSVKNRTGTFVFFINSKWFGVLTTYVNGENASKYKFTSSLPMKILSMLKPELAPLLKED